MERERTTGENHPAYGAPPVPAEAPSKPITVTVEEQRSQSVRPGADVTFICTAKSKVGRAGRGHQEGRLGFRWVSPAFTSDPPAVHLPASPTVSGLHPGLDPPAQRETANPGHGLQRHPDHSERAAE